MTFKNSEAFEHVAAYVHKRLTLYRTVMGKRRHAQLSEKMEKRTMPVHDSVPNANEAVPLPACHFCGGSVTLGYEGQPATSYHTVCTTCGACGPTSPTVNGALLKYQVRPVQQKRRGFMCLVDWELHMEGDTQPVKVYIDEETLRQQRNCIDECGMAEVDVVLVHKTLGQYQPAAPKAKRPYKQRIKNG